MASAVRGVSASVLSGIRAAAAGLGAPAGQRGAAASDALFSVVVWAGDPHRSAIDKGVFASWLEGLPLRDAAEAFLATARRATALMADDATDADASAPERTVTGAPEAAADAAAPAAAPALAAAPAASAAAAAPAADPAPAATTAAPAAAAAGRETAAPGKGGAAAVAPSGASAADGGHGAALKPSLSATLLPRMARGGAAGLSDDAGDKEADRVDPAVLEWVERYVANQYRTLEALEHALHEPRLLVCHALVPLTPERRRELVAGYYAFQPRFLRLLIARRPRAGRDRKEIDAMSVAAGVRVACGARQAGNFVRIFFTCTSEPDDPRGGPGSGVAPAGAGAGGAGGEHNVSDPVSAASAAGRHRVRSVTTSWDAGANATIIVAHDDDYDDGKDDGGGAGGGGDGGSDGGGGGGDDAARAALLYGPRDGGARPAPGAGATLARRIEHHFLLPAPLALEYARLVFLARHRFVTAKKRSLQALSFTDLRYFADVLRAAWSAPGAPDIVCPAFVARLREVRGAIGDNRRLVDAYAHAVCDAARDAAGAGGDAALRAERLGRSQSRVAGLARALARAAAGLSRRADFRDLVPDLLDAMRALAKGGALNRHEAQEILVQLVLVARDSPALTNPVARAGAGALAVWLRFLVPAAKVCVVLFQRCLSGLPAPAPLRALV